MQEVMDHKRLLKTGRGMQKGVGEESLESANTEWQEKYRQASVCLAGTGECKMAATPHLEPTACTGTGVDRNGVDTCAAAAS